MELALGEHERIDDLQYKGLRIIQNPNKFCFGTDAVLLSGFATIRRGDRVLDLGTGTGIIPILLAGRQDEARITGLEIQADMVEMASRSIRLNQLQDRVKIIKGDIKDARDLLEMDSFDLVVSNPPYKKLGSGLVNPNSSLAIARHELLCTLEDVIGAASDLLRSGARFAMIHQSDRLADIIYFMRTHRLEPKRLQMVHPNKDKPPNLVLVEGIKDSKPHIKWSRPLFVYDDEGNYSQDIKDIYHIK